MARRGFLIILANVDPADEAEFNEWYDREHMQERVAIPGFLSAQRYISAGSSRWKYLAVYEAESLDTFRSDVYRKALASQSTWSKSILTKFRDPQRCVAERVLRAGYGNARMHSLFRLKPSPARSEKLLHLLSSEILPRLARRGNVMEASLMVAEPSLSGPVAEYPKGGLDIVRPDDWFISVGTSSRDSAGLDAELRMDPDLIETLEPVGTFEFLWGLHRTDLQTDSDCAGIASLSLDE